MPCSDHWQGWELPQAQGHASANTLLKVFSLPEPWCKAGRPPCPLPACPFPCSWPKRLSWSSGSPCLMNTGLFCTRRTLILPQNPSVPPTWTGKTHPDAFLRNDTSLLAQLPVPSLRGEEPVVLSWSHSAGSALTPGSCNSWSFPRAAAAAVAGELPWAVLGCSMPLGPALLAYTNSLCKKPWAGPLPGVEQHQHAQGHAALASCPCPRHPLTTGTAQPAFPGHLQPHTALSLPFS